MVWKLFAWITVASTLVCYGSGLWMLWEAAGSIPEKVFFSGLATILASFIVLLAPRA